jgi:hypothetical protein
MMEQWNSGIMGSGLRLRFQPVRLTGRRVEAYGSERIMQCWINGPATDGIGDKIKMDSILLKTNIPAFQYSILGANSGSQKNLYILSRL